jgi:glutathione S-transferase
MALTFYYAPFSSATRVHVALEELGVPYEKRLVNMVHGENREPAYLAINPHGKVPALVDGAAKLFESLAILIYLGEKYGTERNLWPKLGSPEYAEALSWSVWGTAELMQSVIQHALHTNDELRFALPKEKRSTHVAESAKSMWKHNLDVLEKRLEGRDFILGKHFTLVDTACASVAAAGVLMAKFPLDAHPNVAAWVGRWQSRPAFGRVMSEYGAHR